MKEQPKQEHHKMLLVNSYPSGADEFCCPTCGRRIIIQWPPEYKKTVLDPGDENASHGGGKGGFEVGKPQLVQQTELTEQDAANLSSHDDNIQLSAHDKDHLAQWEQWLSQMGFENLWSSDH